MIRLILPNHTNQDETVHIEKTRGNLSLNESIFSNVNVTENVRVMWKPTWTRRINTASYLAGISYTLLAIISRFRIGAFSVATLGSIATQIRTGTPD